MQTRSVRSPFRVIALIALVLLGAWLVAGFTRGPRLAAAAFAPSGALRVDDLETTAVPFVPPFFLAHARGEAYEGARFWNLEAQYFLVEPLSGWTIALGASCPIGAFPRPPCASWELSASRPIAYWVIDARTLGVNVWDAPEYSCAIATTEETTITVRIDAQCHLPLFASASTSESQEFDFEVHLDSALGNRRVLDGWGHFADVCATPRCR